MRNSLKAAVAGAAIVSAASTMTALAPEADAANGHYYGAIAISVRTGNTAYAIDYPSVSSARNAAIRRCGAGDCRWVVTMDNNCGAAAQHPGSRRWGWAYAPTAKRAGAAARNAAGYGSRTVVWACTTRPRY